MNRKGFTLLELLVVVLIIGILAAIALPQYRFAVYRAKLVKLMPLMKAVKQANQLYYMNNGRYTHDFTEWDIGLPEGTTQTGDDDVSNIILPDGHTMLQVASQPSASAAMPRVQGWVTDTSARLWTAYGSDEWRCYPQYTELGQKLCKRICASPTLPAQGSSCEFKF